MSKQNPLDGMDAPLKRVRRRLADEALPADMRASDADIQASPIAVGMREAIARGDSGAGRVPEAEWQAPEPVETGRTIDPDLQGRACDVHRIDPELPETGFKDALSAGHGRVQTAEALAERLISEQVTSDAKARRSAASPEAVRASKPAGPRTPGA